MPQASHRTDAYEVASIERSVDLIKGIASHLGRGFGCIFVCVIDHCNGKNGEGNFVWKWLQLPVTLAQKMSLHNYLLQYLLPCL